MATRRRRWNLRKWKKRRFFHWKKEGCCAWKKVSCKLQKSNGTQFVHNQHFCPPSWNEFSLIYCVNLNQANTSSCLWNNVLSDAETQIPSTTVPLRHKYMLHVKVRASALMIICEEGVFPCSLHFVSPPKSHSLWHTPTLAFGDRSGSSSFYLDKQEQHVCNSRKPG